VEKNIKKVLIIEDDPDTAKLISDTLEEHGFICITAKNAVVGLRRVQAQQPDLILLDLMLPKMSGFGFMRLLQRQMGPKKIPVLVLSALNDWDITRESLSLGAVGYLGKACIGKELVSTVKEYAG
jgi:two-component system OmpR family response regulator/two-component system alkaline phosphatase synthesis response regulator PhoP